jgi:hypothetical protein
MVTAVDCQVPTVGLVAMLTEEPTIPTKFKIWWMCFWWKRPGALLSTVCKISLWNSRMAGSHSRVRYITSPRKRLWPFGYTLQETGNVA